jgi:hypothetical protein
MDFCEQMFTKTSQNSDISASCSENIVTVAFYVNVKSCRYFINRLALIFIKPQRPLAACGGCVSKKTGKMHRSLRSKQCVQRYKNKSCQNNVNAV